MTQPTGLHVEVLVTATDLSKLEAELLAEIAGAADVSQLEAVRVSATGKKGRVSELMSKLGLLPAEERKAFGQSVGSFQHNKFKMAELQTKLEVTQAYVDDCIAAHAEQKLTAVDAAKAKWFSAQVQNDVLDECVQLYGGYGFMNEYRVARAWRDARVSKIWAGSNEIMKELIGRDLGL